MGARHRAGGLWTFLAPAARTAQGPSAPAGTKGSAAQEGADPALAEMGH